MRVDTFTTYCRLIYMNIIAIKKKLPLPKQTSVLLWLAIQCQPLYICAAEQSIAFNIPAQDLSSALLQFSEQSDIKVFFRAEITDTVKSNALMGAYTPQQALESLLKNTGIQYRFTASMSVILSVVRIPLNSLDVLALEPAMVVYGQVTDDNRPVSQKAYRWGLKKRHTYTIFNSSTATRIDTPLMQLSQSIQVIPRGLIDDQQAVTVSESLRNVSSVVPRAPGITPNFEPTLIRGFNTMQILDGFYQNLNTGDQESLVNIQQIEVIKGANAVLYSGGGGSPAGGVVNLLSKLPEHEAFYEMGVKASNYNFVQPYVDINQPINDKVLLRFTGEYSYGESHIEALKARHYNLNPSITFTNNDSTSLTLQGKYSKWQQQDYQGLPAIGTVAGDFSVNSRLYIGPTDIGDSESELGSIWGTFKHHFNDTWDITVKARYAYSMHDTFSQGLVGEGFGYGADIPLSATDLATLGYPALPHTWGLSNTELFQKSDEMTFQLYTTAQFSYAATDHALILGVDFSEHDEAGYVEFDPLLTGVVDLADPAFFPYLYPGIRQNNQFTKNMTYGGYIQLQSTLYQNLHLLAGFRVGTVSSDYKNITPGFEYSSKPTSTRVLPNIGAVLDLSRKFAFFVNYSEGMRAQSGVNFVTTPEPELSNQIEFGVKFDIDKRLTGQLTLYQINKKNVAVTDLSDSLLRTMTKGKQRSQGFETNINWQGMEGLNILVTYAYTRARFTDDLTVAKGNHMPGVPEHAGRFWVHYAFQSALLQGFSVGAGVYTQSNSYLENANLFKTDAFYTIDATLAYTQERYKLGIAIKNLTDKNFYQRLNYFGTRVMPARGVEVFCSGAVSF